MSAEKCEALVLKTIPFRETSLILHIFTKEHGLIHAVAKGARSFKKGQVNLERGQILELNLYIKPLRELQTVSSINIIDFFPSIREDIIKSSCRDSAFEIILNVIKDSDEHPELYTFFYKFLTFLNNSDSLESYPGALWLFFYRFTEYMGISFDLESCISCGCMITGIATLNIPNGGLECESCKKSSPSYHLPVDVLSFLKRGKPNAKDIGNNKTKAECEKITICLSDFIRYHFDIKHTFKSLDFLFTIA